MTTFFIISGCVFAFSSLVVFFGAQNAPEGFEDETGFHIEWSNNTPDVANVTCIWDCGLSVATA